MKTAVTHFCTFVLISYTGYVSGSALTIAEMVYSDSLETRTRFQVFNDRLEKTVELLIDGVMPRLSPDKRRIAYAGGNRSVPRLALIDQSGNHLTYPPFFLEKHIRGWEVAGLEWSPDSRQIAIVCRGHGLLPMATRFACWYTILKRITMMNAIGALHNFPKAPTFSLQ